ncbi:hypothetical protein Ddc_19051 [Ditylenchus destructor]|nr:hypothetical protein Ddc_19051 [Ditylenchus destructor]
MGAPAGSAAGAEAAACAWAGRSGRRSSRRRSGRPARSGALDDGGVGSRGSWRKSSRACGDRRSLRLDGGGVGLHGDGLAEQRGHVLDRLARQTHLGAHADAAVRQLTRVPVGDAQRAREHGDAALIGQADGLELADVVFHRQRDRTLRGRVPGQAPVVMLAVGHAVLAVERLDQIEAVALRDPAVALAALAEELGLLVVQRDVQRQRLAGFEVVERVIGVALGHADRGAQLLDRAEEPAQRGAGEHAALGLLGLAALLQQHPARRGDVAVLVRGQHEVLRQAEGLQTRAGGVHEHRVLTGDVEAARRQVQAVAGHAHAGDGLHRPHALLATGGGHGQRRAGAVAHHLDHHLHELVGIGLLGLSLGLEGAAQREGGDGGQQREAGDEGHGVVGVKGIGRDGRHRRRGGGRKPLRRDEPGARADQRGAARMNVENPAKGWGRDERGPRERLGSHRAEQAVVGGGDAQALGAAFELDLHPVVDAMDAADFSAGSPRRCDASGGRARDGPHRGSP